MKIRWSASALALIVAAIGLAQDAPKKITRAEALEAIVSKVQPEYPAMAKQLHMSGEVVLEAIIAENGNVEKVTIVSGNPILTAPSAESVKKWKFKPFAEDGKAIKVAAPISIQFKN